MLGKEYTLKNYITEYQNLDVSFETLHYKEVYTNTNGDLMILLSEPILLKYDEEIKSKIITLTLTEKEEELYFYNPKVLSYNLYGTTELWSLLLHVNELHSITQFNKNPLKIYNKSILKTIDTILNLEKENINNNLQNIYNKTIVTI